MRILFADVLPEASVDLLRGQGDECVVNPDLGTDHLADAIEGFDVLVVRSTQVTAEVIDQSDQLGLIVRSGAGTNTIDCAAAADAGIYVCNVPGTNSVAVAELTVGLIIAIDRHIADATADLRRGSWNKKGYSVAEGLHGRTLGIVGVGEIGLAVGERARAFEMRIIAQRKPGRRPEVEARVRAVACHRDDPVNLYRPCSRGAGEPDRHALIHPLQARGDEAAERLATLRRVAGEPVGRLRQPVSLGQGVVLIKLDGFQTAVPPRPDQARSRLCLHEFRKGFEHSGGGIAGAHQEGGSPLVEGPVGAEKVRDVVGDFFTESFLARCRNAAISQVSMVSVYPGSIDHHIALRGFHFPSPVRNQQLEASVGPLGAADLLGLEQAGS